MKKTIEIDLDSFSHFWLIVNKHQLIKECSEYYLHQGYLSQKLCQVFEFIQPTLKKDSEIDELLINKILHLRCNNTGANFRYTGHLIGENILFIGWPSFSNIDEIQKKGFMKYMRHPACQLTDTIILKDVLKRHQQTIRNLEIEKYEKELEEQRKITFHQSKLATIGELSAGIAHEINNPLAVSMGLTEILRKILKKEAPITTKVFEYLDKQSTAHTRIRNIVQGLQNYARIDNNEVHIFSLETVIQQTLNLMNELLEKDGIKIQHTPPPGAYNVKGIPGEFQQILMNLLTNARHALCEQAEKIISLKINPLPQKLVLITVSDNGMGIPQGIKDKIFKPFFTTKDAGVGTGLGLAITQKIVKKMGGEITVESEEGQGANFKITLPVL